MKTGLLWFDDDPKRTVVEKASDAAERFLEKFGVAPNAVYVSKRSLEDEQVIEIENIGKVRLIPASNILVSHLWVGAE